MLSIFRKWKDKRKAQEERLAKVGDRMFKIQEAIDKLTFDEAMETWARTLSLTNGVIFVRDDSPKESPEPTTHLWRLLRDYKSIELHDHVVSANLDLGGYEPPPGGALIALGEDGEGWFARHGSEIVFWDNADTFDFDFAEKNGLSYPSIYHAMLSDVLIYEDDVADKVLNLASGFDV